MPAAVSTTRWRDQPVVPDDYADVGRLVKVARKARGRIVEFDWSFTRDDLSRLRRAVYEWGVADRGIYKCFDSRVLAAVNSALDETNSVFVLKEPKNAESTDCKASCASEGDGFRLQGHAPFDIVFGYGEAGVQESGPGRAHLGPTARATLAAAVGMLDWDLRQLQEERFRPVRNALYGMAGNYGIPNNMELPRGPEEEVTVKFSGPFAAVDDGERRCLFRDEIATRSGVYLWTITVDGEERPWYVGQTRQGFGTRMAQHFANFLSGAYATYDPAALARGENQLADGAVVDTWPETLPSFLENYERFAPSIIALVRLINVHVAPLTGDRHLHDRVEGAIGRYYKSDPALRNFFTPGLKLPAAVPFDNPIRLLVSSEVPIAGLPTEIHE
ncbi:MAG: GIY-YIG nuclease family protein [Chloroflexi bacterium]|nr:GIY-YIG nuclease family protein [Chloroflexota bacterium]